MNELPHHTPCDAMTRGRGQRQCTFFAVKTVDARPGGEIHLCTIHRNRLSTAGQVALTDGRTLANNNAQGPRVIYPKVAR